jgi:hypothetical protein
MQCPECGFEQEDGRDDCTMCGVIFARIGEAPPMRPAAPAPWEPPPVRRLDRTSAGYMGCGFAAALVTVLLTLPLFAKGPGGFFLQLPHLALGGMSTLVHEMGHALFAWLAGRAAIPAFDLRYGGGVTAIPHEPSSAILVILYLALGYAIVVFHRNLLTAGLLVALGGVHALYAFTDAQEVVIQAMGHGTELLFAVLALQRGLTGRCVAHEAERFAYSLVGWFLVVHNLTFAWGLMTSVEARYWYGQAKGGGHWMDFDRIARILFDGGRSLPLVAGLFFVFCLLTPVAAFLLHRYETQVFLLADRLSDRE